MAVITGTNGNDTLPGTLDADTINALLGKDVVDGLDGFDTLVVDYSGVAVDPYAGAAVINIPSVITSSGGSWGGAVRTVDGSNITTFSNIEYLQAKLDFWHNTFVLDGAALASGAMLTVDGWSGTDTLQADFTAVGPLNLDFSTFVATASWGWIANFEIFQIRLGAGADTVTGGSMNDILAGGGGSDTLDGGAGADILYAGALSPVWTNPPHWASNIAWTPPVLDTGSEVDNLQGGSGRDTIYAGYGDVIDGGADGADLLISLQGAPAGVTADFRALANGGTLTIGGGLISNIIGLMWVEGSEYDDVLTGSDWSAMNFGWAPMYGRGGNDHLTAGFYTGNIYGGEGNDTIDSIYGFGNSYHGEAGDDVINSLSRIAHAFGGDGSDTLNVAGHGHGGGGNDIITIIDVVDSSGGAGYGDSGDDQLNGAGRPDMLAGGEGADTIYGNGWTDLLFSGFSTDLLNTGFTYLVPEIAGEADNGTEHDQLFGGDQDDRLSIGYGDDADGGAGTNILALSLRGAGAGVTLSTADIIGGGTYVLGGGTIKNIHSVAVLWGSSFADSLTFAPQSTGVIVYGEGGDDVINATGGGDTIHGGAGADIINAGGGDDTIWIDSIGDVGAGEQINGGSGNDTLRTGQAGPNDFDLTGATLTGIETVITFSALVTTTTLASVTALSGLFRFANGGVVSLAGNVTTPGSLFFSLSPAGNTIDLTNVQSSGFMQVYGQAGDDVITAGPNGGDYYGGGGNDVLTGAAGFDFLYGNEGNDRLDGRGGGDWMTGGTGDDVYILDHSSDRVFENAGEGNDTIESSVTITAQNSANVETLKLTGTDAINATGNNGDNVLIGNANNNSLNGLGGADSMTGGEGHDTYFVDNAGDVVIENGVEDTDEVRTSLASYSLVGTNVENLTATSSIAHDFRGNQGPNVITGGAGNDFLRLQDGGGDTANGGGGDDVFLFGSNFGHSDTVNGGTGRDQIALQGNYSMTIGLGVLGVESIALLPGSDTRFGDPGTNFYDYSLGIVDTAVAAGVQMIVDASGLRPGEDFSFEGLAETDGSFFIYGGRGVDTLTGGWGNDAFYFGEGLQFGSGDVVNGGHGGIDQLGLRGSYTIVFGAGQLVGIENIGLVSAQDTRFGPMGASYNYNLTMNDGNVVAGSQLTLDAFALRGGETLSFNGSAETNGTYRIFGGQGHDNIIGGSGNDTLAGNRGADNLTGGGGADTFRYNSTADSSPDARDHIHDFAPGLDKIDLIRIDADTHAAGDQAFHWIGANAFTGSGASSAGELRAYLDNGNWFIEGDTDGNGIADLRITMTEPATLIGQGDFLL